MRLLYVLEPESIVPVVDLFDVPEDLLIVCPVLESITLPELSTIRVREDVPEFLTADEDVLPDEAFLIELFEELRSEDERKDEDVLPEDVLPEAPIDDTRPAEFAELVLYEPELLPERLVFKAV